MGKDKSDINEYNTRLMKNMTIIFDNLLSKALHATSDLENLRKILIETQKNYGFEQTGSSVLHKFSSDEDEVNKRLNQAIVELSWLTNRLRKDYDFLKKYHG